MTPDQLRGVTKQEFDYMVDQLHAELEAHKPKREAIT